MKAPFEGIQLKLHSCLKELWVAKLHSFGLSAGSLGSVLGFRVSGLGFRV